MSSIKAGGIPINTSEDKIKDFFAFCGTVSHIAHLSEEDKTKTVKVEFANESAVSTALLLDGAELEGSIISVSAESFDESKRALANNEDSSEGHIPQEAKPKTTIFAEYLAQGYKLSDILINKAIKFDQDKGLSQKFSGILSQLDAKCADLNIDEKMGKIHNEANAKLDWDQNVAKGKGTLADYYDRFKHDKYGSKIDSLYQNAANNVLEVHEQAKRIAAQSNQTPSDISSATNTHNNELPPPYISSIAPDSSTAANLASIPFEAEKKK
ncbi:hypothetical protein DAMA08_030100 [Martiniozyma asiatica (nom. inval.)]|nr:hypothetical protein DAMA08_030100 [Martiniozyma asiatica]